MYSGLLEQANERRYANNANPLDREAACGAVHKRIASPFHPPILAGNLIGQNALNGNVNELPSDRENEYDKNDARLDGVDPEEAAEQRYFEHAGVYPAEGPMQQRQRQTPVPNEPVRRPYHALARENAESLNAFLTRDLPLLTHQLQQTMQMMNELIQQHLDK